jgi:hypothetical protein
MVRGLGRSNGWARRLAPMWMAPGRTPPASPVCFPRLLIMRASWR